MTSIPGLLANHIPEELGYACRFWTDHVVDVDGPVPPALIDALRSFIFTRLLQWIELMALQELLHTATEMLLRFGDWLQVGYILQNYPQAGINESSLSRRHKLIRLISWRLRLMAYGSCSNSLWSSCRILCIYMLLHCSSHLLRVPFARPTYRHSLTSLVLSLASIHIGRLSCLLLVLGRN